MLKFVYKHEEEINMKYLGAIKELNKYLDLYSASNMVGKPFDCTPVRELCENLAKEDPEKFSGFITEGTDHELMVSVSNFLMDLLMM